MNFDIFPQLIMNAVTSGSFYALLAVGLTLIYGVMDIQNFAHGSLAVLGAYFYWTFHHAMSWPIVPSISLALLGLVIVGLLLEYVVFLRIKEAHPLVSLVSTIGVGIVLKNLTLMIFDARVRSLGESRPPHIFLNGDLVITDHQILILVFAAILMSCLWLFLKKTKTGKTIRAVSNNKELSSVLGIDVKRIITIVVMLSTALAGIAGIMAAYDKNLHPNMALALNIKAFSAVLLGGLGSIPGAILGAFILGFAENILLGIPFGKFYLPSSAQDAIAFAILIMILAVRPFGIFGMGTEEAARK